MNMIDRVFLLSHPKFHQQNFKFIIETFLGSGYLINFIFDTIFMRLKTLFNKRTKKQNFNNINDEVNKGWFLIPFIPNMTEKFKNITNIIKISFFQS